MFIELTRIKDIRDKPRYDKYQVAKLILKLIKDEDDSEANIEARMWMNEKYL